MCNLLHLLASAAAALTLSRAAIISKRTACTPVLHTGRLRVYENSAAYPFPAMLQTEAYLGKASPGESFTWVVPPTDGTEDTSTGTFHFSGCPGESLELVCKNCKEQPIALIKSTDYDSQGQPDHWIVLAGGSESTTGLISLSWIWDTDGTFIRPVTLFNDSSAQPPSPMYAISDASHYLEFTASATVPMPGANNIYYGLVWEED